MKTIIHRFKQAHNRVLCLVIVLFCLLIYANTLGHDFAWDDTIVIVENERVREGISGIPELFFQYRSDALQDSYGYRPLTLASFAIEYSLFGLNPLPYHLFNILWFSLLCVVIFLTLRRLFPSANPWFFLAATLIFAAHPLHVEVVANIKSRDEIFALLFSMISLYGFVRYMDQKQAKFLILSVLSIGAALLSKEGALMFTGIFPLVVLLRSTQSLKDSMKKAALPLALIFALIAGIWLLSQSSLLEKSASHTQELDLFHESPHLANPLFAGHTASQSIGTGFMVLGHYYKNLLLPYPLSYYSGYNQYSISGPGNPWALFGIAFSMLLLTLAVLYFRKRPLLSFSIGFFLLNALLYTHWLRPLPDLMADRFMFAASLGFCLLIAYAFFALFRLNPEAFPANAPPFWREKPYLSYTLVLLILCFGSLTVLRNPVWKNNLSLFENDMPRLENCARAHYLLANELSFTYQAGPKAPKLQKRIIHHYRRSIEISQASFYSYIKLGRMYMSFGNFPAAYAVLDEAINLYPDRSRPYFHKAFGLFSQERYSEALPLISKSQQLAPGRADTYYFLAWSRFKTGQKETGVQTLQEAKTRFPEESQFLDFLSDMLFEKGDSLQGIRELEQLIRNFPTEEAFWHKLLARYQQCGLKEKSDQFYQEGRFKGIFE